MYIYGNKREREKWPSQRNEDEEIEEKSYYSLREYIYVFGIFFSAFEISRNCLESLPTVGI